MHFLSFLFFDFFSDLGFGSVHLKAESFSFPPFFNPVRVRVPVPRALLFLLPRAVSRVRVRVLEILILFLYFFSDLNTDLFFLPPRGGGGDRVPVTSATPGPFSLLLPG